MTKRGHNHRRILIDRLKSQFLAIILVYLLAAAAIFSLALFAPLIWELNGEDSAIERARAAAEFLSFHTRFWPALLLTAAAMLMHSIFTPHRILDPLSSLRDHVHRLATAHGEAVRESTSIERALQTDSIREARVHLVELERALTRQQQQFDAFGIEAE